MRLKVKAQTLHERMRRIRQRDTAPELAVRRIVAAAGLRYRVCCSSLPGRPDIANRSRRWAIFVHGCFWHGHEHCQLATLPKTNTEFWVTKLEANRARDRRKESDLVALGLRVFIVWQCQINDERVMRRLVSEIRRSG